MNTKTSRPKHKPTRTKELIINQSTAHLHQLSTNFSYKPHRNNLTQALKGRYYYRTRFHIHQSPEGAKLLAQTMSPDFAQIPKRRIRKKGSSH